MPNCFSLYPKGSTEPKAFNAIDDDICSALGVTPDPIKYHLGWYDYIGFAIACGQELGSDKLRANVTEYAPLLLPILDYLETNYSSNAWAEISRR